MIWLEVSSLLVKVAWTCHLVTNCCDSQSLILSSLKKLPWRLVNYWCPYRCGIVDHRSANSLICENDGLVWCPRAQTTLNLEGRDLDHWNLHSMLKISYAAYLDLSVVNSSQFTLGMCLAAQNCQKIHKTPILAFKVIEFGANREPVYDFLLRINSNLGSISHHYWDTATYRLKITNFSYHPLD